MKIVLQLRGRENQYEDLAMARIEEFIHSLESVYKKDANQKMRTDKIYWLDKKHDNLFENEFLQHIITNSSLL